MEYESENNLQCDQLYILSKQDPVGLIIIVSIPAFWNNSPTETCVYVHFGLNISFDCTFILEIDAHFEYICLIILFYVILLFYFILHPFYKSLI